MAHCNRCGAEVAGLLPEAPPPDNGPAPLGPMPAEGSEHALAYLVCGDCHGLGGPYRYCGRCGQETPAGELRGGRCDWCRAADDIPFEEPADDAWWEGKTPGAAPPPWWPRI